MSFWDHIKQSTIKDGKPSSSRIIGYFMSVNIALSGLSFVAIDIVNAIIAWNSKEGSYEIPGTHVALFGMMLAHQLSLLGIYKTLEKNQNPQIVSAINGSPVNQDKTNTQTPKKDNKAESGQVTDSPDLPA